MSAQPDPIWDAEVDPGDQDQPRPEFRPTLNRPIPGMQCTGTVRNGEKVGQRCSKRAVYGAQVCASHGAQLPVVRKRAAAMIEAARLRLIDNADLAVETLEDLVSNASSEAVRLKAATEILDRSGVRGGTEVDVTVTAANPADALRERLDSLRRRTIEGEVVQGVDDTLTESADTATKELEDGEQ